ncbi:filamentous hemagglutinin N-terminal domain-containing protein [Aphanizomenon flos-aquae]|nr:filamentous hemagglutinin N-terminal domain-containing protein [Aphanizomenon flos-aquae]MBD2558064.1 filamentous hemagglutinin N-terminal domain-containing protein [Aphanizomenon flos-aquae FACHB-1290]
MKSQKHQYWKLAIKALFIISGIIANQSAFAQLIPDNTLGKENSIVNQIDSLKNRIEGGATRGSNLFHSFQEFNVDTGKSVYFANPVNIQNILTRVTGGNISNILGTLGVEGTANLFLINPQGIYFGNGASLDIRGSFTATTADSIKLGENGLFSASNPESSNLLSVQPGALFINALKNQQAQIKNEGNLQVNNGKNITLFGANVTNTGTLTAPEGTVELTGAETLKVRGNIETGTLLLNTKNLTIGEDDHATIDQSRLEGLSGNTNLIFQATNDINIQPLTNNSLKLAHGNGNITLTADADSNGVGNFQMNTTDTIKTNGRNISISGADLTLGDIDASSVLSGGNIIAVVDVDKGGVIPLKGTAIFNFTVSDEKVIENLDVQFSAKHTWDSDITVSLTSPSNTTLKLFSGVGARGHNFEDTLLDDSAATSINGGSSPFSGPFKPLLDDSAATSMNGGSSPGKGLAAFNGENPAGKWTLKVDDNYTNDSGILYKAGETAPWGIADGTKLIFRTLITGIGNSGGITLNATKGNINVSKINAESSTGIGGEVNLSATENINLNSSLSAMNNINILADVDGNGVGNFQMNTTNTIKTNGQSVEIKGANLTVGNIHTSSELDGGNITLTGRGNISTQSLNSHSFSYYGIRGNGGEMTLTAGGNISTLDLYSGTYDTKEYSGTYGTLGNGGNITLTAGGNISSQYIYSRSSSFSYLGIAGNGGEMTLNAGGDISTQYLYSSSYSDSGTAGSGGGLTLNAGGNISIQSLNSSSYSPSRTAGNGGDITLKILEGKINILYIKSGATGKGGNGGKIQLTGEKLDIDSIVINNNGENGSNGGLVKLNAPWIQLKNSDISSSSYGSGNAGQIELNSTGDINLNNSRLFTTLEPGSTGEGGNIQIQAQNLNLSNFAVINTGSYSSGNAGNININAENVSLQDGSSLQSLTTDQGNAGNILLNVKNGNISLNNSSSISTSATKTASGNSGNIKLDSRSLSLLNGSQIQALTEGQGTSKAGEIIVNVNDSIIISGVDPNFTNPDPNALPPQNIVKSDYSNQRIQDIGTNNSITTAQQLQASDFYIDNPGKKNRNIEYSTRVPYTSIRAIGDDKIHVYAMKVNTGTKAVFDIDNTGSNYSGQYGTPSYKSFPAVNTKLTLLDSQRKELASNDNTSHGLGAGGSYTAMILQQDPYLRYTFTQGGTYYIQVSNFDGQGVPSGYDPYGNNKETSYDLQISLEPNPILANITNQGQPSGIFAYTTGAGKAGNINLNTTDLKLEGGGSISAFTNGSGNGGNININANTLTANNGAQFLTTTSGIGKAGNITVNVKDNITLDGTNTGLFANTEKGSTGDSGSITIDPQTFMIKNGAGIGVNSQGSGQGGNISIEAGTLTLDNNAVINAATASSQGGEITLQIQDLLFMNHNSNITATAGTDQAGGNGGNINIYAPFIVAVPYENNDITANAYQGNGGNIKINTNQIFGLQYRPQLTNESDITASSQFGVSGDVVITTPGVDPTSGLINLPTSLVNIESLNKDVCAIKDGKVAGGSSFIITGKGGLPADTEESITNSPALVEWENNSDVVAQANISPVKVSQKATNYHPQIQQVQGWIITPDGKVILTADSQKITLQTDKNNLPDCK